MSDLKQSSCYTYILECADGTLYTGWTNDIQKRLDIHNSGKGAKYTRARLPVRLLSHWQFESKSEAMKFELELKSMTRKAKIELVNERSSYLSIKVTDRDKLSARETPSSTL